MDAGMLIREGRRRAGLTQAQLAARLGTTQSVVVRWETGKREPSFATVRRALRACGLELQVSLAEADPGPLGVATTMAGLTPEQKLAANVRLATLRGAASRA